MDARVEHGHAGHPGRQVKTWSPLLPPPAAGNKVYAVPCNDTDSTQRTWMYDSVNKAIKGPGGKCLDAKGSKVNDQYGSLFLNDCDTSELQQFVIGDDGTVNSVTQKGKCLDIWAGHGNPGGPGLQLYNCHGAANEQFMFEASGAMSSQGLLCLAGRDAVPDGNAGQVELWAKPLESGRVAAFILNNGGHIVTSLNLADLNITGDVSVRDIWKSEDLPAVGGSYTVELEEHDSAMVVFSPKQTFAVV